MVGVFDCGVEGNLVIVGNCSLDVVIFELMGDGESGWLGGSCVGFEFIVG